MRSIRMGRKFLTAVELFNVAIADSVGSSKL